MAVGSGGRETMPITLDEYQTKVLRETIEDAISSLRAELRKTESHDYREQLNRRKTALEAVLRQLAQN